MRLEEVFVTEDIDIQTSFNSKLVRLEAMKHQKLLVILLRFNSKLVRLEAGRKELDKQIENLCFNSKLVRLEDEFVLDVDFTVSMKFQFQTGAIRRMVVMVVMVVTAAFQFQTGAIRSF